MILKARNVYSHSENLLVLFTFCSPSGWVSSFLCDNSPTDALVQMSSPGLSCCVLVGALGAVLSSPETGLPKPGREGGPSTWGWELASSVLRVRAGIGEGQVWVTLMALMDSVVLCRGQDWAAERRRSLPP